MASYAKDIEQYHKERVREVLALNPRATERSIQKLLEEHPDSALNLSRDYIRKLKRKIEGERAHRFDHAAVDKHIAQVQDRAETVISTMWTILLDQKQKGRDRVAAAQTIIKADIELWKALLDGGVFERKLGTLDLNANLRNRPVPPEVKEMMLKALQAHLGPALVPATVVEVRVPEAEEIEHGNLATTQPSAPSAPGPTAGALG